MTGEVIYLRDLQRQESREETKEKQRGHRAGGIAFLTFAAGIALGAYGVRAPSTNLTRHLEDSIVDPFAPKIHNDDYLSGPYAPFLVKHKDEILEAADRSYVPPEMIAGVIVKENYGRWLLEDWKDATALAWNSTVGHMTERYADPSLGVGQMNVQTAQNLSRAYEQQQKSVEEIQEELEKPERNIAYVAMMLSDLLKRENRATRGTSLFDDPELVAIIATEYVRGPTTTSLEDAEPNREGVYFVQYLGRTPCIRIFGDDATITEQQQAALRKYAQEHMMGDNLTAITADAYRAFTSSPSVLDIVLPPASTSSNP